PPRVEVRQQVVVLGSRNPDSPYHMEVVVTTKGAGIQSLTFNKFRAANAEGLPTDDLLSLIPDDRRIPSYVLYHFAKKDDKRPVVTLGNEKWEVVRKKTVTDERTKEEVITEVVLSAHVPGRDDLKVTKTFTLAPHEYHVGLTVEVERNRQGGKEAEPFRYQLMGAHGLPIEGVWYTSIFRNALFGRVDAKNYLWRD